MLRAGISAMVEDANTPQSFKVGQAFEDYVREFLFINNYYTLLELTHNYNTNQRDYVESSLKPDFTFRDHWSNKEFYVEAKFRTALYDDKFVWCNQQQLDRYNFYNRQKPVFLILGYGKNPQYPEFLSLIPISKAKYAGLYPSFAEQFEIEPDKPITSKMLWNR